MEPAPEPIDTGRRRVYDADAMDRYIAHLHARIASLHAQLRTGGGPVDETASAVVDVPATPPVPARPSWREVGRQLAAHLARRRPRRTDPDAERFPWLEEGTRPPSNGSDLEAEFWSPSNRLEAAEDPSYLGRLGDRN